MKEPRRSSSAAMKAAPVLLAFLLLGGFLLDQQARVRNNEAESAKVDAEIEGIKKEILSLETQLAESRKAFEEQVASLPKNAVMVCGDTSSYSLERSIKFKREEIDSLQAMKTARIAAW